MLAARHSLDDFRCKQVAWQNTCTVYISILFYMCQTCLNSELEYVINRLKHRILVIFLIITYSGRYLQR